MNAYSLDELLTAQRAGGRAYREFLRVADLSAGVYVLPAGGTDPQQPHSEDELYHVVRGRATIVVAGDRRPVLAGDTMFVAAGVEHRFVDIEEELVVLVVFGPAEGARASA